MSALPTAATCTPVSRSRAPLPAVVRVLLVNTNRYDQPYPVYPLGLAYLKGALEAAGHRCRIWDAAHSPDALETAVAEFAPDLVGLSMRNIDNVQYHRPESFVGAIGDFCRRIRAVTSAVLVLGGSAFSVFPEALLALTQVDYGIRGAGEGPLLALIAALQSGLPLPAIPGVVARGANGAIVAPPATAGGFPARPAHDAALLQAYVKAGSLPGVQTQRGCPLHCCYCTYPVIEGRQPQLRPAGEIVAELRQMAAAGVRYVFFVDSVFNTRADHVAAICEEIIRAGLDLHWECFLRPAGLTRDLLALMQSAGLRHIEFGSDSFSDPVLKRYGKSFTFEQIREASAHAHALGLHYSHFLIFGGPGETAATVEETLARAATLPGAYYFATIGLRIYPGTPLWTELAPEQNGEDLADYLAEPRFHLAPGFTVESLFARLLELRQTHHNWVVGDPPPAFVATIKKLRDRGLRGPLWEYIELLQRLEPPRAAATG